MDTQERIRDRILRKAAQIWGYTDSDLETSFDPVVGLLLKACASELEKLSVELDNSRSRVIERLLEIMTPESKTGVVPSRSVMYAAPAENNFVISTEHQFLCRKTIQNIYDPLRPDVKELYFGTTLPFTLAKAELEYLMYDNALYSLKRVIHKDPVAKSSRYLPAGTLWLGLKIPKETDTLKKLMFFTDIRNVSQREMFYNYLKQAKIFIKDKEIPFREGYNIPNYTIDIDAVVNKNYNRINQIYTDVNNYYFDKFFHLAEDVKITGEVLETPEELIKVFEPEDEKIKSITEVLWLKIQFPEVVIGEVLENVMFYINAIPVVNKKFNSTAQKVDPFINYVPLSSNDIFLDLDTISDSRGHIYHLKEFSEGNLENGDATLRHTGVTRFDERNASELIQYLIELLKDESASFTAIGSDNLRINLMEFNQKIADLEQHIKEKKFTKTNFPYVIIKPKNSIEKAGNDGFVITYWTTGGEDANDLKTGTRLQAISNSDFADNSVMLLNASVGGKSRMSQREKITSYREALLTRGRAVTFADVKTLCQNHFKYSIKNVEIKKGTKIDSSTNNGFVRTIDIFLERNDQAEYQVSDFEWQYLCDNFLYKLEHTSSNVYPYRLIVK